MSPFRSLSFFPHSIPGVLWLFTVDDHVITTCFVLTEPPDNLLISVTNSRLPVVEGNNYDVRCDVINVAPVGNLRVSWYKGDHVFHTQTFDDSTVYPANKSSVISLVANRNESGTDIWCEAKLVFEPTAPILPSSRSNPVSVTVMCKFSLLLQPYVSNHKWYFCELALSFLSSPSSLRTSRSADLCQSCRGGAWIISQL